MDEIQSCELFLHVCRLNPELAAERTELVEERQRREHAEADTLRATVRLSTLEQLLAQLRLAHSVGELENAIAAGAMPAGK